jgi:hypothetical protein
MVCDALFQLGMGPVELDTTQTEDFSSLRSEGISRSSLRSYAELVCVVGRLRGNSTKALIPLT